MLDSHALPAAPLKLALSRARRRGGVSWEGLAQRLGISSRTILRVMASVSVSEVVADRIAIRLGLHPAVLWPDEWALPADPEREM